jgi:hypothetical protein
MAAEMWSNYSEWGRHCIKFDICINTCRAQNLERRGKLRILERRGNSRRGRLAKSKEGTTKCFLYPIHYIQN